MGRGSSKAGGDGPSLGGGSGKKINVLDQQDVWSYRHRQGNEPFVDAINGSIRDVQDDFPGLMNDVEKVNSAKLGGADAESVLGFYSEDDKSVSMNENYTNINKMNAVYDAAVESSYHPGRGNKNGTQAVTYHEVGHALTDHVGKKMGAASLDDAAKQIVDNAYKNSKGKGGTKAWAGKISGYAQENNAECIAEAVCDWYCNGNKAASQSKAIMTELKKWR